MVNSNDKNSSNDPFDKLLDALEDELLMPRGTLDIDKSTNIVPHSKTK